MLAFNFRFHDQDKVDLVHSWKSAQTLQTRLCYIYSFAVLICCCVYAQSSYKSSALFLTLFPYLVGMNGSSPIDKFIFLTRTNIESILAKYIFLVSSSHQRFSRQAAWVGSQRSRQWPRPPSPHQPSVTSSAMQ